MIKTKQNLCGSLWYLSALCGQRLLHKVHREDTEFHRETRMKKFTWHAGDLAKGLYFNLPRKIFEAVQFLQAKRTTY